MLIQPTISRFALPDNERSCKGRYDGDGDGHRIEERTGHPQGQTQRCDNKGKFTDLRQREGGLQRQSQVLARDHESDGSVHDLADNHNDCQQNDRSDILPQQSRFNQHTD